MRRGDAADPETMRSRGMLALAVAAAVAGTDLAVKGLVVAPEWAIHQRSHRWVYLSLALLGAAAAMTTIRSRALAVAAGMLTGGVLGNLGPAAFDGLRVENPLIVGQLAFTVADVFVLAGIGGLTVALAALAFRYRRYLPKPRRWERALLRRLAFRR